MYVLFVFSILLNYSAESQTPYAYFSSSHLAITFPNCFAISPTIRAAATVPSRTPWRRPKPPGGYRSGRCAKACLDRKSNAERHNGKSGAEEQIPSQNIYCCPVFFCLIHFDHSFLFSRILSSPPPRRSAPSPPQTPQADRLPSTLFPSSPAS